MFDTFHWRLSARAGDHDIVNIFSGFHSLCAVIIQQCGASIIVTLITLTGNLNNAKQCLYVLELILHLQFEFATSSFYLFHKTTNDGTIKYNYYH